MRSIFNFGKYPRVLFGGAERLGDRFEKSPFGASVRERRNGIDGIKRNCEGLCSRLVKGVK
jgi:hypothetical protein